METIEDFDKLLNIMKYLTKEEINNIRVELEGNIVNGKNLVSIKNFTMNEELFEKIKMLLDQ